MDSSSVPVHIVQAPAIAYSEISHVPAATGDVLVSKPLLNLNFACHKMDITNHGFEPFLPPAVCRARDSLKWTFGGAYAGQTVVLASTCCTLTDSRHVHGQCCKPCCMGG
jgi:hypothetical protein